MRNMLLDCQCPFDGDFCDKKQKRLDEWRNRWLVNPHPGEVFITRGDMFDGCPVKYITEQPDACDRYRRYLFIVNKVKQELVNNEQR